MIVTLPDLVTPAELAQIKQLVASAGSADCRDNAGELLQKAKNNEQIPWYHPVVREISGIVMQALGRWNAFMNAAQSRRRAAMLVSRDRPGMAYGLHAD